jgi:hypothetical protein
MVLRSLRLAELVMICESCKEAGRYNALANPIADNGGVGLSLLQYKAKEFHDACTDFNCPCAHYVGQALNKERVTNER